IRIRANPPLKHGQGQLGLESGSADFLNRVFQRFALISNSQMRSAGSLTPKEWAERIDTAIDRIPRRKVAPDYRSAPAVCPRRAASLVNCSNAASRSSVISAAMMWGAGSASVSVRLLSLIQN